MALSELPDELKAAIVRQLGERHEHGADLAQLPI